VAKYFIHFWDVRAGDIVDGFQPTDGQAG
jgi:hypothetical protein